MQDIFFLKDCKGALQNKPAQAYVYWRLSGNEQESSELHQHGCNGCP
jgi:hypothetical protein